MPYSKPSEAPDYVPEDKKSQWIAVFNSAFKAAKDEGKSDETAEASGFAQANGVAGPKSDDKAAPAPMTKTTTSFIHFIPLMKVDAVNRTVTGILTDETPDKTGEICDYESSKPFYKAWSEEFARNTAGKSLGNVREMHKLVAAGKLVDLVYDDVAKQIIGTAKIVDDDAWKKCEEGVYTGFSHGGDYVDGMTKQEGKYKRYTAKPTEVSIVDNPCNPNAHFTYVKADGTTELRKFQVAAEESKPEPAPAPEAAPAEVPPVEKAAPELTPRPVSKSEAPAPEPAKTEPVKKTALTQEQVAEATTAILVKVIAKKANAEPAVVDSKLADLFLKAAGEGELKKGMRDVARFANLLLQLAWLKSDVTYEANYEDHGSPLPQELQDNLEALAETFLDMAEEETKELVEAADLAGKLTEQPKPQLEAPLTTCEVNGCCAEVPVPLCCTTEADELYKASEDTSCTCICTPCQDGNCAECECEDCECDGCACVGKEKCAVCKLCKEHCTCAAKAADEITLYKASEDDSEPEEESAFDKAIQGVTLFKASED